MRREPMFWLLLVTVLNAEWPEAERELSRSIELNPGQTRAHYELARVYLRVGKPDLARAERAEYERLKSAETDTGRP